MKAYRTITPQGLGTMRAFATLCLAAALLVCVPAQPANGTEPSVAELGAAMTARYARQKPQQWFVRGPGITSNLPLAQGADQKQARGIALTLDACEGKTDTRIIALLREHQVPATIFVTNRWLRGNAALAADLASDPLFTLQAHGVRHKPASVAGWSAFGIAGTANIAALVDEVESSARAIAAISGKRPRWYRSGTAFYDEVALAVIHDLGFLVAGFAVSGDSGATLPGKSVARRLLGAKDGDIILCHINHPESGTWEGLNEAIPKMIQAGTRFVGL